MTVARFFGLLRLELGVSSVEINAQNITELLEELDKLYDNVDIQKLRSSVIFVNDKSINELKGYKTKLKMEDEVIFLSPVSGG